MMVRLYLAVFARRHVSGMAQREKDRQAREQAREQARDRADALHHTHTYIHTHRQQDKLFMKHFHKLNPTT